MKKTIRIWIAAAALLVLLMPSMVFAADASVSVSGGSVEAGKNITVTVTYKGSSLGYVNGQMTYDNSKLEYLSGGSSQGDAGLVELKSYANDASGKLSFKVKFKAKASGNVKLNLETLETSNLDGDQDMGTPSASATVKISAAAETTEQTEATTEETAAEETTEAATQPADTATDLGQSQDQESETTGSSINYPILIIAAIIILALIVVIIRKLRRK